MLNVFHKLIKPLDTICGWICAMMTYLLTLIGDGKELFCFVFVASVIDMLFGCVVSIYVKKRYFESGRLRDSIIKMLCYVSLIFIGLIIDKTLMLDNMWIMRGFTAIILVTEVWSILTNITILKPDFLVGKLLKKFMIGEISKKLDMDEDKVMEVFDVNQENKTDKKEADNDSGEG